LVWEANVRLCVRLAVINPHGAIRWQRIIIISHLFDLLRTVITDGRDTRDDQPASPTDFGTIRTEIPVFPQYTMVFFVDTNGVFDRHDGTSHIDDMTI
jgi:hypothetical protein